MEIRWKKAAALLVFLLSCVYVYSSAIPTTDIRGPGTGSGAEEVDSGWHTIPTTGGAGTGSGLGTGTPIVPKTWIQGYEAVGAMPTCSTEVGSPTSTTAKVGASPSIDCDDSSWSAEGNHSLDLNTWTTVGNYIRNIDNAGELDFTGDSMIYLQATVRRQGGAGFLLGRCGFVGLINSTSLYPYPYLAFQPVFDAPAAENFALVCNGGLGIAVVSLVGAPPDTHVIQADINPVAGTDSKFRVYLGGVLQDTEKTCVGLAANIFVDGMATGVTQGACGAGAAMNIMVDDVRISNVPFGPP